MIVKVQIDHRVKRVLTYNMDRSYWYEGELTPEIKSLFERIMGEEVRYPTTAPCKLYFHAKHDKKTGLMDLGNVAPTQVW